MLAMASTPQVDIKNKPLTSHSIDFNLEFAVTYQNWTVEDWELAELLYETSINHLELYGRKLD